MSDIERRCLRRIAWRIIPLLGLGYFMAFLDRQNIGVAALTMNGELGLSATVFGFSAGIFFWGYFLFEVPSNFMLRRVGARIWIARIMITWGLLSAGMAFVGGSTSLAVMRFLLGVAEAGFFPGIIYYLTEWIPASHRGRMIAYFMAFGTMAGILGPPASSYLLQLEGIMGWSGWRWMFFLEGLPAVLLGFVCYFVLRDRPDAAEWLPADERAWLTTTLASEQAGKERHFHSGFLSTLYSGRVVVLSLAYFGFVTAVYGLGFWLPQVVKSFGGLSNIQVGYITALPSIFGLLALFVLARSSDRTGERTWHIAGAGLVAVIGFLCTAATLASPMIAIVFLCIAVAGTAAGTVVFWTLPTAFLSKGSAASGVAMITSIGNLSGYFAPQIIGILKDSTGSFGGGLALIALGPLAATIIVIFVGTAVTRASSASTMTDPVPN